MKSKSLTLYYVIVALNIFLFLPALFYPIIAAPFHILILWLSFDWLLKNKTFESKWNRILFAAVPMIGQLLVAAIVFFDDATSPASLINLLNFLFFFFVIVFCGIEFAILNRMYSMKFLKRKILENI